MLLIRAVRYLNFLAIAGLLIVANASAADFPEFDPAVGELPESIARDSRGNTYASLSVRASVIRIGVDGTLNETFIPNDGLPEGALGTLGLTVTANDRVFVAVQGCGAAGCSASNGVWGFNRRGQPYKLRGTEQIPFPNDVTTDSRGNLYVSDTVSGAIWILRRNSFTDTPWSFRRARIWVQDPQLLGTGFLGQSVPLGANGIVYSDNGQGRGEILVANTEQASVFAIPINRYGSAGELSLVTGGLCPDSPLGGVCNPSLLSIDGIDVDRYGDIFAVTVIGFDVSGPVPISTLHHIKRRTGDVQLVHTGNPLNLSTDVSLGKRFDDAKTAYIANPGFTAPAFGLLPEPSIASFVMENSWFEAAAPQ